jgi:hypothetical protein
MARVVATVAGAVLALTLGGSALAAPARQAAAKVTVTFTDKTLRVTPTTPSAGATTFVVKNLGKKVHVLVVKGPGLKGARSAKLSAGRTATLTVTLQPGAYVLSDPIGLGEYNVMFLDVIKAAAVHSKGDSNVVAPDVELPPMCGQYFTP